ncbi:polysaccharide deacetylase family protein [Melittangium boletus]|uniref:polysaccharide deacetylase family protein n=1 Tax=Melittangium boletus TaxID=83453 RepID=UPI003DA22627
MNPSPLSSMIPRSLSLAALALLPLSLTAASARAAGPQEVATLDRSLWPITPIAPREFDQASRAENLVFAQVLGELEAHPEAFPTLLGVKQVHTASVSRWLTQVKATVAANLRAGRATCRDATELGCAGEAPTAATVVAQGRAFVADVPERYKDWLAMDQRFYAVYAREQLRLAALFPGPTSEILTFGAGEETGADWPDREFLLTFDDGPTPAGGGTDKLAALLRARKANGVFFVLGDALKARQDKLGAASLKALYEGQCVASHGQKHVSHQKLATWKESLDTSRGLVAELGLAGTKQVLFRPPYGQRTEALMRTLTSEGSQVMLWNIDSQDWNARMAARPTTDRVITLMLLWRRGIVLFHDVHDKVHQAVPELLDFAQVTGLRWRDCHTL